MVSVKGCGGQILGSFSMYSDKIYDVSKKGRRVGSKIVLRRQWEGRGTLDMLVCSVYRSPRRSYLCGLEVCTDEARVCGGCSGDRPQSQRQVVGLELLR